VTSVCAENIVSRRWSAQKEAFVIFDEREAMSAWQYFRRRGDRIEKGTNSSDMSNPLDKDRS
jgi:hypothetical protein